MMLNVLAPHKHWKSLLTALTLSMAIFPAVSFPAIAEHRVIIQRTRREAPSPMIGNMIYGSPIPAPMPVNPITGTSLRHSTRRYEDYYDYPRRSDRTIKRSTLINPTIIDSEISDSILINPTIIRDYDSDLYYDYDGRRVYSPSGGVQIRIRY